MNADSRRRGAVAVAASLVLGDALAGCAKRVAESEPDAIDDPDDPATWIVDATGIALAGCASAPTPDAEATAPPAGAQRTEVDTDPATWIVDERRVGPFALDGDIAETLAGLEGLSYGEHYPDDGAIGRTFRVPDGGPGEEAMVWVSTTEDGRIVGIRVELQHLAEHPTYPATAEGLTVGSTRAEIDAVHADATETPVMGATMIEIEDEQDGPGSLSFELDGAGPGAVAFSVSVVHDEFPDDFGQPDERPNDPNSWFYDTTRVGPVAIGHEYADVIAMARAEGWDASQAHGDGCTPNVHLPDTEDAPGVWFFPGEDGLIDQIAIVESTPALGSGGSGPTGAGNAVDIPAEVLLDGDGPRLGIVDLPDHQEGRDLLAEDGGGDVAIYYEYDREVGIIDRIVVGAPGLTEFRDCSGIGS
ncbi:hypothetical protein [Microbacterium rhizophilus]|uniref:hypothetical protein n=1 Tax=Microbacterium rhizophilus TaxID=3138934 RepID=UPI0031E50EBB